MTESLSDEARKPWPVASIGPGVLLLVGAEDGDVRPRDAPVDDRDYAADRPPEMRLLADGDKPALRLEGGPSGLDFRMHPEMGALHELYQDKRIALVHASGLDNGTRSHFGAQELIERGIANPDETAHVSGGWMARWRRSSASSTVCALAAPIQGCWSR